MRPRGVGMWAGNWGAGLVVALAGVLFTPLAARAKVPETPRFISYGVDEGLASTTIISIENDRRGYLWIATRDGLARFDGVTFKNYQHDPTVPGSLPANAVSAVHVDGRDRVWVATTMRGVSRLDPSTDQFVHIRAPAHGDLIGVWSIASTRDGSTWFGTYNNGLYRLDKSGNWQHFRASPQMGGLPSDEVLALAADPKGGLWIGTGAGLLFWDGNRVRKQSLGDLERPRVISLTVDEGGLWVGTMSGTRVRRSDGRIETPSWLSDTPETIVFSTRIDGQKTRWIATATGLWRVVNGRLSAVPTLRGEGFRFGARLVVDEESGLWIGREGGGLLHLPAAWRNFAAFPTGDTTHGFSASVVRGLSASSNGKVWIGGAGGGLDHFDTATGNIERVISKEKLSGCRVYSTAQQNAGNLWVGCFEGLFKFSRSGSQDWGKAEAVEGWDDGSVNYMLETPNGLLWVVGRTTLQAFDGSGRLVRKIVPGQLLGRASYNLGAIRIGPEGKLWIFGDRGIQEWSETEQKLRPVHGAPDDVVFDLAVDSSGFVWIHRLGELAAYRWNGTSLNLVNRVGGAEGLPRVGSSGVMVDRYRRVWLTTARGLVRYDARNGSLRVYTTRDGLLSHEFDTMPPLMLPNGHVLAATTEGLVEFDTNAFNESNVRPAVELASVSLRREDEVVALAAESSSIVMRPGDRDLRVTARVPSLADASRRRFRFWLHGYDKTWVDDAEGERVFTRLSPADYELEVIAATADGFWSSSRRLRITVLPPWWRTNWAFAIFLLAGVLLVAAIAAAYRARLRRIHVIELLDQRRELAERASQAKTHFLANLGHEIRTPMTGVLGMAELLQSDGLPPNQRGRVDAIQVAGQHLLRLVNDALDLARIEAGRLELLDTPFEIAHLVDEVAALLKPQAEAKGLTFVDERDARTPRALRGDASRIRQILLNLGHNAVKFTERGAVSLRVGPAYGGADGIVLEVGDTGPGMDEAQQERLFRRFEQAEGACTASRYGGSGLGLAICQELANAMGGRVEVESAPGHGTCFRVHLPLPATVLHDPVVPRHVREVGAGVRVLHVEDDAVVAEVVRDLLLAHGHFVVHAPQGLAALAEIATTPFDVVLLDLDLPGLDGLELGRLLRTQWPALPVVALTARADAEAEADAREAGMVAFLRKPATGDELARAVARHAVRRAVREAVPT